MDNPFNTHADDKLYHYCGNKTCFKILSEKEIRMNDIRKSNDYSELSLFYPSIFEMILEQYCDNPFPFQYNGKTDCDGMQEIVEIAEDIFQSDLHKGEFSSFVACFGEDGDLLSQWRGYADDGKGCCLGFNKADLQKLCDDSNDVLCLSKIEYRTEQELLDILISEVKQILSELQSLRAWIVDEMTNHDLDKDTDGLLEFNFCGMIERTFLDSLKYKQAGFSEEREWRIFLKNRGYRNADWILGNEQIVSGPQGFSETIKFLKNKIAFHITDDDIVAYCPIRFSDFESTPIREIVLGPKNLIKEADLRLLLTKLGYSDLDTNYSHISYW